MNAHLLGCIAFVAALAAGIAHGNERTPPARKFETTAEAVATWRDGLDQVVTSIASDDQRTARLERVFTEAWPNLAWGHVRVDGVIVSTTRGSKSGFWAIIIHPEYPALAQPGPTLSTGVDNQLALVYIRPDQVTVRWAGIFLLHELWHLADLRTPQLDGCTAEYGAYAVERDGYDRLNGGRFGEVMDDVTERLGFTDVDAVLVAATADSNDPVADAIAAIEQAFGEPSALSMAEREMRDGFYVVSMLDRIAERAGADEAERCRLLEASLERLSKF